MRESKDKNGPFGLVSAGSYSGVLKSEQFLCTVGCSPFITFYSLKHKNIRNIFMANKIPDLYMISRMETQFKGNLAGEELLQNIPSAICPSAVPPEWEVCSAAQEPYFLPAGTWKACSDTSTVRLLYSHRRTFKIGHIGENMTFHYSNKWEPACLLLMTSQHTFQIWLVLRMWVIYIHASVRASVCMLTVFLLSAMCSSSMKF